MVKITKVFGLMQTSLAQFSLAYMLSDTLYYVIPFTPTDFMFLVHHSISGLYVVGYEVDPAWVDMKGCRATFPCLGLQNE